MSEERASAGERASAQGNSTSTDQAVGLGLGDWAMVLELSVLV